MSSHFVKTLISFFILIPNLVISQHLVSADSLGLSLKVFINFTGLTTADYNTKYYKVTYNTTDLNGNPVIASGMIVVPIDPICDSVPIALYDHGTVLLKADVPSRDNTESIIGKAIASKGYVVAMPDYLGLGDLNGFHPYQHAESEATASVDLLRATIEFMDNNLGMNYSNEIFITGYSQGGHAAMATAKYIQDNQLSSELNITGLGPCSGAYHASKRQTDQLLLDEPYGTPGYIVYLLMAYQEVYGNIYGSTNDVLQTPYNTIVPPLFNGTQPIAAVHAVLPNQVSQYLKPSFINPFIADSTNKSLPLWQALENNDNYDWTPTYPVKLSYCNADDQVSPLNSDDAFNAMSDNGVTVTKDDLGNFSHGDCVLPAISNTINFFQGLRTDCVEPNSIAQTINTNVNIYPIPVNHTLNVEIENTEKGTIQIFDLTGTLILSEPFQSSKRIKTVDISQGQYILIISTQTQQYAKTISIVH